VSRSPDASPEVAFRGARSACSARERAFLTQVASYSAGRDVPAKLISEPSTGTNLDIAATDQIRPTATTTAIPTIHTRICIPSASR
jgi:hypothetical protein